jgi:parallel beta-helix repeat protein
MKKGKLIGKTLGIGLVLVLIGAMPGGLPGLAGKVEASPATIYVPDNYPTIQAAVNAADPGDTIIVRDGTYAENVDVDKGYLTIESENGAETTVVEALDPHDHVFRVTADYVNIRGLTVRNANAAGWTWVTSGICLSSVSHCTLSGNILTNNIAGIILENSRSNTLTGNEFSGNWYWAVRLASSDANTVSGNAFSNTGYYGLELAGTGNTVIGNTFTNSGLLVGARRNTVQDNTVNGRPLVYLEGVSGVTVSGDNVGQVVLVDCDHITVYGLSLGSTVAGIQLFNTASSTVSNCNFAWSSFAVHLSQSTGNVLTRNTLSSYFGIFLANASQNTITENDVTDSAYGIYSWQSTNNTIYLNNFRSMYGNVAEENLCSSPKKLTYKYGRRSYRNYLGNYWSKYSGSDSNGDGIGDTPYPVEALIGDGGVISGQDSYPLMEPFENYVIRVPRPRC